VFDQVQDDQVVHQKVLAGERPELIEPPSTLAEERLSQLMYKCWEADPAKRIDIFQTVKFLRKALAETL
jgi:hypothetical protein